VSDYAVALPYPFATSGSRNLILCRACGRVSYASEIFGIDASKGLTGAGPDWLKHMVPGSRLEDPAEVMVCPLCGAKKSRSLGRKLMNFMIGESARANVYPRRVAAPV